jgi:hypothetical protein
MSYDISHRQMGRGAGLQTLPSMAMSGNPEGAFYAIPRLWKQ